MIQLSKYKYHTRTNLEPCNQCGSLTNPDRIICENCEEIFEEAEDEENNS